MLLRVGIPTNSATTGACRTIGGRSLCQERERHGLLFLRNPPALNRTGGPPGSFNSQFSMVDLQFPFRPGIDVHKRDACATGFRGYLLKSSPLSCGGAPTMRKLNLLLPSNVTTPASAPPPSFRSNASTGPSTV